MDDDDVSVEDQLILEGLEYEEDGRDMAIFYEELPLDDEGISPGRTLNMFNIYDSDSETFDDNSDDEIPSVRSKINNNNRRGQRIIRHNDPPRSPDANRGDLRTISTENTAYNREDAPNSGELPDELNTSNRCRRSRLEMFSRRDGGRNIMAPRIRSCTIKRRLQPISNTRSDTWRSAEEESGFWEGSVTEESSLDASVDGNENHQSAPRPIKRSGAPIQREAKKIPTSRRSISNECSSSSSLALSQSRSSVTQSSRVSSRRTSARSRRYGTPTSTVTSSRQLEPPLPSPRHDNASRTVTQVNNNEDNSSTSASQTTAFRKAQEANSTVPGTSTRKRPATEPLPSTSKLVKYGDWEDFLAAVGPHHLDSSPDDRNTSSSLSSANSDNAIGEPMYLSELVDTINKIKTATIQVDFNAVIPTFDPDAVDANILTWIKKVEYYIDKFRWNDIDTLLYALPKLGGTARSWYRYQADDKMDSTWKAWKAKLIETFTHCEDYAEMLKTMLAYKARIGDSLELYYYQKINLLDQCGITGRKAVDCILDGIEDRNMVMGIRAALFTDVNDLLMYFKTITPIDNDSCSK